MARRRSEGLAERVAVVGGGSIGVAWAIVFARGRRDVRIFEPDADRRKAVLDDLASRLRLLDSGGLLRESAASIGARASLASNLTEAVKGAVLVQECAPERLDVKQALFEELEKVASAETVLASSSSAISAASFAKHLRTRGRCLVAHPANPPYLLPLVEIVPAPFTEPGTIDRARAVYASAGMRAVTLRREIEGFVLNRLQGAILREAYCLVRDGVASPEDVDVVVRDALGRRMAVLGPFETAELNTRGGIESHAEKMGPAYARMGAERGQNDPWTLELVQAVADSVHRRLPPEDWDLNVARRDAALIVLDRARRSAPDLFG